MLKTVERDTYTRPVPAPVVLDSLYPPPVTQFTRTPFVMPYVIPSYRNYHEKLMTDNVWVKGKWKDCQHYKRWVDPTPYPHLGVRFHVLHWSATGFYTSAYRGMKPILTYFDAPAAVFGPFGDHLIGATELTQVDVGDGFIPRPTNLASLVDGSLKAMLPSIKAELSLVNSIIELKDFKSLPQTLRRLSGFVENLRTTIPRILKGVKNATRDLVIGSEFSKRAIRNYRQTFSTSAATLGEATGVAADSYLQTQFNILPLLQDICGIHAAISRTKNRINDLLVRQGKRQHKYFTYNVKGFYGAGTSSGLVYGLDTGQFSGSTSQFYPEETTTLYARPYQDWEMVREIIPATESVFCAQIEYNYSFTRFQTENAQLLGMMDALGVNLNPAIVWNAIPWTFLIDWLTDVSRWLDDRKVLNMEPAVNITKYSWSWRQSRRIRLRVKHKAPVVGQQFQDWVYLPDLWETTYRRTSEMPSKASLLSTSGLSSKELTLGVALAITRRKRYKPVSRYG